MAVTSIWRVKGRLDKVVRYVENPEKTDNPDCSTTPAIQNQGLEDVIGYAVNAAKTVHVDDEKAPVLRSFVTGVNCSPSTAREEMIAVKRRFGKEDGTIAYHGYQSFAPGEATPEIAHEIGVKLAERLWGDRYQVLVATHLDKENHLHSHFVVNTVSFVDGIKYHRTEQDYREMQRASDELCREYGLSVIARTRDKTKSYAEWKAEQEDRPTVRGTIRADIDAAILASTSRKAFFAVLAARGYAFKFTGEGGKPLKYPGLRPPGAKSFFRFNKLGRGYTLEDIDARLIGKYTKTDPYPKKEREEVKRTRAENQPTYKKKVSGLRALYLRYCYELHIIVKHPASAKRVSIFMREDIAKLDRLDAQTRLLANHNIENGEQLAHHRNGAEKEIAALLEERQSINRDIRRLSRDGDEGALAPLRERRAIISAKLKELRREVTLCDSIAERSAQTMDELERYIEEQEIEERRNVKNELLR